MWSTQTSVVFPLSAVKPLEGLLRYRAHCLAAMQQGRSEFTRRREHCPADGARLEREGEVEGFGYGRCPQDGSLFLEMVPAPKVWAELLAYVSELRHSPAAFHAGLVQSRTDHVYAPKLEWIRDTLRVQGIDHPTLLEAISPPSPFTQLLQDSGICSAVLALEEMALAHATGTLRPDPSVEGAVLLESLDRVDDPLGVLQGVADRLRPGGLIFLTALVASGFDMTALGLHNQYLYPPDRTNCFSLQGLSMLVQRAGFTLLEVSTPGVLDVEVVQAHRRYDSTLRFSAFERQVLDADEETRSAFQAFLQQRGLSSFARIVGRKLA